MRLPFTRGRQNSGMYGGFGSKASDKAWQPSSHAADRDKDRVPRRFRRLRLVRAARRPSLDMNDTAPPAPILLALVLVGLALLLIVAFAVRG